jgi:HAD superfamily hydrolase (TIGR01549 family)
VGDDLEGCRLAIWESWLGTEVFHQYPETLPVMQRLKEAGYILGAVSNWEPRLAALCANHGLDELFDFVLASEAEGQAKPGPLLFEKALDLAGVQPEEAVHVGDNYREDVEGAHAVGITAVLLSRESTEPSPHSPTIRNLEQLFPLLEAGDWIQGQLIDGEGVAAGFTELPWVQQQVRTRLGFEPHPGTLNLRLSSAKDVAAYQRLKVLSGIALEPEAGFCAARCYQVLVEARQPAAVIAPEVAEYPLDKIELLAPVRLREALNLEAGSPVTVVVPPGGS